LNLLAGLKWFPPLGHKLKESKASTKVTFSRNITKRITDEHRTSFRGSAEVVLEIKIYKKQKFWFSGNENMLSAQKKVKNERSSFLMPSLLDPLDRHSQRRCL
jgi:hypothetical protein